MWLGVALLLLGISRMSVSMGIHHGGNDNLQSHFRSNVPFGETIRDWLRDVKERIYSWWMGTFTQSPNGGEQSEIDTTDSEEQVKISGCALDDPCEWDIVHGQPTNESSDEVTEVYWLADNTTEGLETNAKTVSPEGTTLYYEYEYNSTEDNQPLSSPMSETTSYHVNINPWDAESTTITSKRDFTTPSLDLNTISQNTEISSTTSLYYNNQNKEFETTLPTSTSVTYLTTVVTHENDHTDFNSTQPQPTTALTQTMSGEDIGETSTESAVFSSTTGNMLTQIVVKTENEKQDDKTGNDSLYYPLSAEVLMPGS